MTSSARWASAGFTTCPLDFHAAFCFNQPIATTFIYALTDPRPGDTHVYIGKADRPRRRFMEHYWELPDDHSRKAHWLRSLLKLGLKPSQAIVCEVPMWQWQVWEVTLIHWYRALGWNIVNTTEGGDGVTVFTPEMRAKCALGFKGRHHTPEARAAIGAAFKGKRLSEEHCAKISAYRQREKAIGRKRTLSAKHRTSIAAGMKGKVRSAETRRRMSAARKGRKLSVEHRAKLSLSHKKRLTYARLSALVASSPTQASNPVL